MSEREPGSEYVPKSSAKLLFRRVTHVSYIISIAYVIYNYFLLFVFPMLFPIL